METGGRVQTPRILLQMLPSHQELGGGGIQALIDPVRGSSSFTCMAAPASTSAIHMLLLWLMGRSWGKYRSGCLPLMLE